MPVILQATTKIENLTNQLGEHHMSKEMRLR